MSDFYTVTINRLQLVSKFDERGVKIADTVMKIPVTHCDLPYATALMYAAKGAPGEVTITQQIREFTKEHTRKTADYLVGAAFSESHRTKTKYLKHIGSEDLPESEVHGAAISGDMGAAITAELEDAT